MSLEQDKSFYCVVDGMVQVFAQTGQSTDARQGLWDHEDMNGYQLLNEVGSGGTLSSLFTILSLFTEDVKMSWQDDAPDGSDGFTDLPGSEAGTPVNTRSHRGDPDVSHFNLDTQPRSHSRMSSASSTASTVHASGLFSPRSDPMSPSSHDNFSSRSIPSAARPEPVRATSLHRGIVARATEDTTLAVIPAEAFKRLTKNFPKATGHIVQGTVDPCTGLYLDILVYSDPNAIFSCYFQCCSQVSRPDERGPPHGKGYK
jgi:lysophospholipid hydrolase